MIQNGELCLVISQNRDTKPSWRTQLKLELLKNVASFQGQSGEKPQSIDAFKLVDALGIGLAGQEAALVSPSLKDYFAVINERRVLKIARGLRQKLINDYTIISEKIGNSKDFR